jgi:two-component system phosphate regulon sensor histidine kinase PhoR
LDYIGTPLVQAIRNKHINDILLKAISENVVLNDEMYLYQGGRRTLSIHVTPIYKSENNDTISGALAYINDITQIRKLEDIRSEFVSNVTHELKTPLTSIQGFVETLKNDAIFDPVVSEKFLDIIEIETERLRMLINDILELSEIESTKTDNDKNAFGLLELVQEVESMLINSASEKEINFDIQIDTGLKVLANRNRIKQLLINLMDNAIKYNKLGGSVTVRADHFGGQVEIHVKDTGIGVPKEHTKRIFERFYRVDKGRSRDIGGTGLGLSIVKHIAQLYGGYINIESEEGKGSDFIVTLPIYYN